MARVRLSDPAPDLVKERELQPLTDKDLRCFRPEITRQLIPFVERLTGARPIINDENLRINPGS